MRDTTQHALGTKRRLVELASLAFVLTLCFLASFAFADALPNAWQVDDESTSGFLNYTNILSNDLQIAATNEPGGFEYMINARLVSGSSSAETMAMAYGLGTNRFLISFALDTNGDLIADLDGAGTYKLTTNGTGAALYHNHEIRFDPVTAQASYLYDGRVMTTNWVPSTNSLPSGEILWGAQTEPGTGTMNFHTVTFMVTNTVVAAYDAVINTNIATAPDPVLSGWTTDPDVPPANTAVTNISPDTVPIPAIPLPTTLDATNVAIHQATLLGTIDEENLAATVWFEWGIDTNYGNTTPAQPLLSDTNTLSFSEAITGLDKGTSYHFRCVATNLQGIAYGQDHVLTTPVAIIITNAADSGPGTLRQAIADSVSGDTITFAIPDTNTITLTNGALILANDLTIVSSNAPIVIDAGGSSRVLEIAPSNSVMLDSLIITNGNASDVGGGILVDGGATLTLTNGTVAGNAAGVGGGGIFLSSNSIVAINNCVFSGNSAANDGGAIDSETNSTLSIDGSVFTENSARRGGAIFNNSGSNILNNCTVSSNSAASGGAIDNDTNSVLIINYSTFSFNLGSNYGGAILNTNGGAITISCSTLSSNSCPADFAGGINNWSTITVSNCTISGNLGGGFLNTDGNAACYNSTFSGNSAIVDGGGYYSYFSIDTLNSCTISGNSANRRAGGLYAATSSFVILDNTIIAGNTAVLENPNVRGGFSGTHNLVDVDPHLAPLGNYGGPTQTMPPLGGSPAINAGIDSVTNRFATDQRGFPRLAGTHVDIGAVEIQPSIVMNTDDDGPGSLRAAVASAAELITFSNTLSGQTIHLASGQLTVSNSVGIDASSLTGGVSIDAGGASRVMEISGSNIVTLDSLTITNGNVADNGGGILADGDVILTLTNCTIAGNSAGAGGGIAQLSGTVTVNNTTLAQNTALQGGGGFNIVGGQAALNNCTLFGNSAAGTNGGGIAVGANVTNTLIHCTITGNSAGTGGGIFLDVDSIAVLTNTIADGNSAATAPNVWGTFAGSNNLTNGDPLLAPFGNYGGPTRTLLPLAGSPAIDTGLDVAPSLSTDQRGYPRLSGAHVDIGAVEAQFAPGTVHPVLKLSRAPGGVLNFAFASVPNADYTILSTTNLALPVSRWDIFGTPTESPPGSYSFSDSLTTNKARFYRVVSP